jgi:hypothetical protein
MQKIIDQLYELQKITPEKLSGELHHPHKIHDATSFCGIINELAETSLSILQSYAPAEEIIPLDDNCFAPSIKMGACLAETHPNDHGFHLVLREAILFFNEKLNKTMTEAGFSGIDFSCLQLFFSQLCAKTEQGFIEKFHAMLIARKHFARVSTFPQQLSNSYICTIIQKLGHIPMAEISFAQKILHQNPNMTALFSQQPLSANDLIPECLFEQQMIDKLLQKAFPEPFFRDLHINRRSFQQLILVLPQNHVFITFVIETPDSGNNEPVISDACLLEQDQHSVELNKIKESFLANMSHELRTPLHEIIGFADLLFEQFDGQLNEAQLEYVQMIQRGGERHLELIELPVENRRKRQSKAINNTVAGSGSDIRDS